MRSTLALLAVLGLAQLLGACTIIDVRTHDHGVHSDAFISGYADVGWPASNSLLKLGVFDGPSDGSILYFQLWKLLRLEVGFLGLAGGIGPLDAGFGILLYHPQPPEYIHCDECEDEHGDEDDDAGSKEESAQVDDDSVQTFVYHVY
jgi:hypothetical protein